ncbi:V-type ATP synthase subunit D [Candidatus Woesearchaeota archaeon]|nr:V-type ATP synthase subunit D [Candidatus Woesearchaeota archaeon]
MSQNIKPTRSELQNLKKRIKLAESGYNLLKKKRDGLILEFFEVLKQAKSLRKELTEEYKTALQAVNMARVVEGDLSLTSLSMAVVTKPEVELMSKNIMGVVVPKIKSQPVQHHFMDRGYGTIGSSTMIDNAAFAYEKVVEKVIQAAETETTMKKLLEEIEKTKRRVNALEFEVIPKMKTQMAFIKMRLEEMDRENVFRMKRIKE